jgi:hypothetical protein
MTKLVSIVVTAALCISVAIAQKQPKGKPSHPGSLVLAVLNDGKLLEPIAVVENGTLKTGDIAPALLVDANKAGRDYSLLFGGKKVGKITVIRSNSGEECGASSAEATATPPQPRLKGLVMGLATNASTAPPGSGTRRRPTAAERSEIESLVRTEFVAQGASTSATAALRYHNLTALDVNRDGVVEFVGSYWIAPPNERRLLFFIAEKGDNGKYALSHHEYKSVKQADVMSGDLADLDTGLGHELLLDVYDFDRDGIAEVFTILKAFEGNNYFAYRKADGEWTKVHETYVYHCAF